MSSVDRTLQIVGWIGLVVFVVLVAWVLQNPVDGSPLDQAPSPVTTVTVPIPDGYEPGVGEPVPVPGEDGVWS